MKFTPSMNSVKLKKDDTVKCSTNTQSNENNCCTSQPKDSVECPMCREKAKGVLEKTFNALVKEEVKSRFPSIDGFYYCKTPSCKVVYFRDESIITQEDMNITVGLKDGATPATICYCFDWTKEKITVELQEIGKTIALEDIKAKMQNPGCSCEVLNPSGRCCLSDITKAIKEIREKLSIN